MIVVFGSLGVDLVTNVSHIPHPGETVLCDGYFMVPGGKGANQAVAAARAGSKTAIIGSRGNDGFADLAVSVMAEAGVDISALRRTGRPTAVALITVEESGENAIVVASGANQLTDATQLEAYPLAKGDIVLLQREIRDSENFAAIAQAKARGARVILNVAPAGPIPADMLRLLDDLVVNEHEALVVARAAGIDVADPEEAVRLISERFGCAAIVTLGADGVVGWIDGVRRSAPALKIVPVDTTAAGDTFTGAYAAALEQGFGFTEALARGAAAGSLACTRPGAQSSIPTKAEIDENTRGLSA
ncbi:ribokinase [Labrys monachus]|uniref:Ribokinase n=1 Tax=Labrys monachus TaxID=217067 RepID=A0ABU0FN55_9HYPH|nr:ribokinase [Labrys monachus]MDQ0396049.1 ribokinase [Labrys monachus]